MLYPFGIINIDCDYCASKCSSADRPNSRVLQETMPVDSCKQI